MTTFRAFAPILALTMILCGSAAASTAISADSETIGPWFSTADEESFSHVAAAEEGSDIEAYGDCGGCQECDCCCRSRCPVLTCLLPSDRRFACFISPMTNPVFFEDPRQLTEARAIFIQHRLPPALGATSVRLFAVQARARLTENLSLIATKDGFIMADPAAPLDDGWADISLGLKYTLFADYERQQLVSAGVVLELPFGSRRALQGNGSGEFNIFLSAGTQFWDYWHYVTAAGFRLPTDTTDESQVFYWSQHVDRQLTDRLYALVELNWFHWLRSGGGGIPGVEGGDLFNFGSTGVAGNNIVTGAFGLKYRFGDMNELGIAWEFPLTDRRDLLDNRLTVDLILRY